MQRRVTSLNELKESAETRITTLEADLEETPAKLESIEVELTVFEVRLISDAHEWMNEIPTVPICL